MPIILTSKRIVPVKEIDEELHLLELWHGPTAAFKDLPLQFMSRLLSKAMDKETAVLVATSGDTGKAALEGFKNVEGTYIIVFYPKDGVSKIQKLQMVTTGGNNTAVIALKGDFDDCQNGVKDIFSDREFKSRFDQEFSSANSINWGRLAPQIIYWFHAYSSLLRKNRIQRGEKVDIVVPTGNFGDILSAYYASKMGLPVGKFVCASNDNNVLTDFFRTGTYNADRQLKKTISPAMDILISSNLERFLFDITGKQSGKIREWYSKLDKKEKFTVDRKTKQKMDEIFHGEYATEEETLHTIGKYYEEHDYPLDPHTAVGVKCYEKYREKQSDEKVTLLASTANPFKFSTAVLKGITGQKTFEDKFENIERLRKKTGWPVHRGLKGLQKKEIKHDYCSRNKIRKKISEILKKLSEENKSI